MHQLTTLPKNQQTEAHEANPLDSNKVSGDKAELLQAAAEHQVNVEAELEADAAKRPNTLWGDQALFHKGIESILDIAIYMIDTQGIVRTWNPSAARIKGFSKEEILGQHYAKFYLDKDLSEGFLEYEMKEAREKGHYENQGWRIRRDGSKFWADEIITPIYDDGGKLLGYCKTTRDLSRLKQTEEQLRAVADNLNLAIESANIGTWDWDLITKRLEIDTHTASLLGINLTTYQHTLAEIIQVMHPDDRSYVEKQLEQAITKDCIYEAEYRVIRSNQNIHYICARGKVYYDTENKPIRVIGSNWDVTLEKQRQHLLEAKNHQKNLEEFMDTLCHELRNPLNGIYGSIELLQHEIEIIDKLLQTSYERLNQELRDKLNTALAAAKDQLTTLTTCAQQQKVIVDDVLDLSRLANNKVELVSAPFSLQMIIRTATEMVNAEIKRKNLTLELDLPENDYLLKADHHRLMQIILNLLSNAIKFTNSGTITIIAIVQTESAIESTLSIAVKDTGIGMTSEEQGRLFKRFSQANRTVSQEHGGSGLGLVICKQLVEKMGGAIEVESQKWQGTQFTFGIKCQNLTEAERLAFYETLRKRSVDTGAMPQGSKNQTILIVEDNLANQKILKRYLEEAGYVCETANDGVEALKKYEEFRFDLVFMDIEMPKMSGLEATVEIRKREMDKSAKLTIIGLSGNARREQIDEALKIGMNDYLTKPFHKKEVLDVINKYLSVTPTAKKARHTLLSKDTPSQLKPTPSHATSTMFKDSNYANSQLLETLSVAAKKFMTEASILLRQNYPFIAACSNNKIIIHLPEEARYRNAKLCENILLDLKKYLESALNHYLKTDNAKLQAERLIITLDNPHHIKSVREFLNLVGLGPAFDKPQAQTLLAETEELESILALSMTAK